ncbi:zinc finger protein, putative [Bodo saltans]|uniref:Zinc finger protein, putative n=1 Tax=Bodo saltans TaxID=75058 RepID=A0A0S4IVF9_BODSA|nr:zinc finger protein, putative [Bodo saltans]|eukprot:CUF11124.1 zinc finger protein, putative [Bodo saltans]
MSFSYWHADKAQPECEGCYKPFTFTVRRHHCRDCGGIFCHQCSSRAVIMFHRASPTTRVRICKFCVAYVDARLTTKIEEERAASLERPGIYNETFVKNFASTKRVLLAPEDTVHAGYRLNRILQRSEALFLPSNDLFIRKDENHNINEAEREDEDGDNDEDAPPKTVRTVFIEGDVRKTLQTSSPPTALKDPQMNFPKTQRLLDFSSSRCH